MTWKESISCHRCLSSEITVLFAKLSLLIETNSKGEWVCTKGKTDGRHVQGQQMEKMGRS